MSLIVVGVNHKTAPVEIREKIAFNSKEAIKEALKELIQREGIGEVVIISTCNRVEIYVYTANVSDLKRKSSRRNYQSLSVQFSQHWKRRI